jgi:DNA-binding NarL/FixJ family response regulator
MLLPYFSYEKFNLDEIKSQFPDTRRVLVVESDETLSELYASYLEHLPVLVACSNEERWSASFDDHKPHIMIINVELLLDSGFMKNGFRQRNPHLHIIAVGGGLSREALSGLMDFGVSSYINRLITRPHDMAASVAAILNIVI